MDLLAALDLEQIPRISLGTAALLIFGAIASLAVLRGLLRILWGTVTVCLAGLAGFYAWKYTAVVSRGLFDRDIEWLAVVLPALAFLVTLLALRFLGRTLVHPLGTPNEETAGKNRRSPLRWATTLLFSLVPTVLLWFAGAALLRHFGSVSEIRDYVAASADSGENAQPSFLTRVKQDIEQALPENWFDNLDPLTDRSRVNLAKLISVADDPPPKAIPVLEEEEIRRIVASDDNLRRLARQGRYAEILRDPRLDQLLENDNLRQVLAELEL